MSVEFFAKLSPQPFRSLATNEKERIAELKQLIELDRLKRAGKLPPEPEPPEARELFYE